MKNKTLLTLAVAGLMAFGTASCGGEKPNTNGLNEAADYIWQLYKNESSSSKTASTANYDVVTSVTIDDKLYNVSWTIDASSDGIAGAVKLGKSEKGKQTIEVLYDPIQSTKATEYTLNAKITDEKGNEAVKSFERVVPEFKFSSFKDVAKPKEGRIYNVKGVITQTSPLKDDTTTVEKVFIQNGDFGIMGYNVSVEKGKAKTDFKVGTEIILSGNVEIYHGQIEMKKCTYAITNPSATKVGYKDITSVIEKAKNNEDVDVLNLYQNSLVEIKGVTIGSIDNEQHYNYFKKGNFESYMRCSGSLTGWKDDQAEKIFDEWIAGYEADVKGLLQVYSGKFYITPIELTPYTITKKVLTDDMKAENAIKDVQSLIPGTVAYTTEIKLPATAAKEEYNTVKYTWSVVEGDNLAIADGKLKVTSSETAKTGKVKVVATQGTKTAEHIFTIKAQEPTEFISIADFIKNADSKNVTYLKGIVVAEGSTAHDKNKGSFILSDGTNTIFSFNKMSVNVGDEIVISTTFDGSRAMPQSKTIKVEKVISTGNDITPLLKNKVTLNIDGFVDYIKDNCADDKTLAKFVDSKTFELTGIIKQIQYNKYGLYINGTDEKEVVQVYLSDAIKKTITDGTKVVLTGFARDVKSKNKSITLQATSVTLAE